jgi:hypothetical protein
LAKINRNYTFEEAAAIFGVHKNTVASWVKDGLPCLKAKRPFLIIGAELKSYLKNKRACKKQKCKPCELYCMSCKRPTTPFDNFVEYIPSSPTKGRLTGFCCACERTINKFTSFNSVTMYSTIFDLSYPKELEHISDTDKPLLNSDFN